MAYILTVFIKESEVDFWQGLGIETPPISEISPRFQTLLASYTVQSFPKTGLGSRQNIFKSKSIMMEDQQPRTVRLAHVRDVAEIQ